MDPRDFLKHLMTRSGDNPNSLSIKLHGATKQPQIHKFLTGVSAEPRRSTLRPVANFYGVELDAFYDRRVAEREYNRLFKLDGQHTMVSSGTAALPASDIAPPAPVLRVPMLSNAASMGAGEEAHSEDVVTGDLTLSPSWVSDIVRPTKAEALRFIHGYGDSMHPTFNSGDVLLVDTGVREVKIDGIYVLSALGRLFIKRVRQRIDGQFEISSDNPTHKTVDTLNGDHSVAVLGRVVWAWNGKRV